MKLQLLSDLHLETHPGWRPTPAPGADLLVLAGDIGSYQAGSALTDSDFGLGLFSNAQGWPTPVVFVPGNHEYDAQDFDHAHARLQETCQRLGIVWLERAVYQHHGVRLVGTTLWSDLDALASGTLSQQLQSREKARRATDHYLRRAAITRYGQPWLAAEMRAQALECQAWLRAALEEPFDGPTVVVTHFAPSLRSADPRYGLTPGTAGFCNALDPLLSGADLWLHGHLHTPLDYRAQGCRVVANPLGYARKNEQLHFAPATSIAIHGAPTRT